MHTLIRAEWGRTQRKQTHQRFFHCSVPVFLSTGYKSVWFFSVGYHCLFQHRTPALGCVFSLLKLSLALTTQDQHPSQHSTRALPSVQNVNDSLNTVHQHFFLLLQLACPPASASSSPDRPLHTPTQQALSLWTVFRTRWSHSLFANRKWEGNMVGPRTHHAMICSNGSSRHAQAGRQVLAARQQARQDPLSLSPWHHRGWSSSLLWALAPFSPSPRRAASTGLLRVVGATSANLPLCLSYLPLCLIYFPGTTACAAAWTHHSSFLSRTSHSCMSSARPRPCCRTGNLCKPLLSRSSRSNSKGSWLHSLVRTAAYRLVLSQDQSGCMPSPSMSCHFRRHLAKCRCIRHWCWHGSGSSGCTVHTLPFPLADAGRTMLGLSIVHHSISRPRVSVFVLRQ